MDDLEYIKSFSKINITKACKKLKINRSNLLNNKTTKENILKVRQELESEVAKLYVKKDEVDINVDIEDSKGK